MTHSVVVAMVSKIACKSGHLQVLKREELFTIIQFDQLLACLSEAENGVLIQVAGSGNTEQRAWFRSWLQNSAVIASRNLERTIEVSFVNRKRGTFND